MIADGDNSGVEGFVGLLVLAAIIAAIAYGTLQLTDHAKRTWHAGPYQADDIQQVFEGKQNCGLGQEIKIRKLPGGREVHYCAVGGGWWAGLVIAAGVIITGFCAATKDYWRNCR